MFQIEKTLISEDIIEHDFVCNLSACKGACCVDGEYGAPLEEAETKILDEIRDKVTPFLSEEGIKAISKQGTHVKGEDGEWETPLVKETGACAYVVYDDQNIAKCGLEEAHKHGATDWKKPISCHLYPVRIKEYSAFTAVNYHRWQICDPACALGTELKVPIYVFVKEALVRKFGEAWYAELKKVAEELSK